MPVRIHARRRILVINAGGELDLVSVALLDAAVDSALDGPWPLVVVDCAELEFVDVVGARPLRRLAQGLTDGRAAWLVNVGRSIEPALRWLGLGRSIVPVEEVPMASDREIAELLGISSGE